MTEPQTVAYVLKGYPRRSEIFIASEIHRLERLGVRLRLFVLKPPDEQQHHPVVDRVEAEPVYLPATASLSASKALPWLRANLAAFVPALRRVAARHPRTMTRAAGRAIAQSVRARRGFWAWPRKLYLKEFLLAVALTDQLDAAGDVRHLHAHFAHGSATVAWLAATITGIPFSFTGHAKDVYSASLNPAGLLRRKMAAAEFVVTCTAANRTHLRRLSGDTPVHLAYHGLNADFAALIDHDDLLPERPGRRAPVAMAPRLRILGVGRLVPKKGFDILIQACALLRRQNLDFELVIAGETGEHEPEIRRLIERHGLADRICLVGPQDQAELYQLYRHASVFCLPCRVLDNGDRDGIPNVLVEAMACGLPVVTTAVSGIPELVSHDSTGLLVPPDDPRALAAQLLRVARDPQLARRLAASASASVAERFDGDRLAMRMADLFTESLR
jgi:glycosyltransferase involved in cell wall biosynthesis